MLGRLNGLLHFLAVSVIGVGMSAFLIGCSGGLEEAKMENLRLSKPLAINTSPRLIALGYGFTAAIKSDGSVWTWGDASNGVLARKIPSEVDSLSPGRVSTIDEAKSVVAADCVLLLKKDGTVWSWGKNDHGQLGYKTNSPYSEVPRQIPNLRNVIDISVEAGTSQALLRNGKVYGWGWNASGKLGQIEGKNIFEPTQISGLSEIVKVEVGMGASYAIDRRGVLWSYGANLPKLGRPDVRAGGEELVPREVVLPSPVADISARSGAVYALLVDGSVWSWGFNKGGELGLGVEASAILSQPRRISSVSGIVAIASDDGGAAISEYGGVAIWGVSAASPPSASPFRRGDLNVPHRLPFRVSMPVRDFVGGMGVYAILDKEGNLWFWKANNRGQRGVGVRIGSPDVDYWISPERASWTIF